MAKNRTPTPVYLDPGMHSGLEVKGLIKYFDCLLKLRHFQRTKSSDCTAFKNKGFCVRALRCYHGRQLFLLIEQQFISQKLYLT